MIMYMIMMYVMGSFLFLLPRCNIFMLHMLLIWQQNFFQIHFLNLYETICNFSDSQNLVLFSLKGSPNEFLIVTCFVHLPAQVADLNEEIQRIKEEKADTSVEDTRAEWLGAVLRGTPRVLGCLLCHRIFVHAVDACWSQSQALQFGGHVGNVKMSLFIKIYRVLHFYQQMQTLFVIEVHLAVFQNLWYESVWRSWLFYLQLKPSQKKEKHKQLTSKFTSKFWTIKRYSPPIQSIHTEVRFCEWSISSITVAVTCHVRRPHLGSLPWFKRPGTADGVVARGFESNREVGTTGRIFVAGNRGAGEGSAGKNWVQKGRVEVKADTNSLNIGQIRLVQWKMDLFWDVFSIECQILIDFVHCHVSFFGSLWSSVLSMRFELDPVCVNSWWRSKDQDGSKGTS